MHLSEFWSKFHCGKREPEGISNSSCAAAHSTQASVLPVLALKPLPQGCGEVRGRGPMALRRPLSRSVSEAAGDVTPGDKTSHFLIKIFCFYLRNVYF